MRSSLADAPLVVSTDGTAGPYITVTTEQLEPVVRVLRAQGIVINIDDDAVMLDGRPALAVIDLGHGADVEKVQGILDSLAATWRGAQPEIKPSQPSQNKLVLKFSPLVSDELKLRIETTPPPGWARRLEIEERMLRRRAAKVEAYCFSKKFDPSPGEVAVWLQARGVGELYVSTVIPLKGRMALSVEQYNRVLGDFERTFIEPLMRGLKGRIFNYKSPTEPTLEDLLSTDSMRRLRNFSATANKRMPHALDIQRWHVFIARTHLENVVLDTSQLSDWLECDGWPESQRLTLIDDYELGRSLLTVYDEERADR